MSQAAVDPGAGAGPNRAALLEQIAGSLACLRPDRRLRVAIDGVDGAGKTTFADELAGYLAGRRPVVRASVDGFHQPRTLRYRRGRESSAGFYLDSYDYPALLGELLEPLASGGDGRYRTAIFDVATDAALTLPRCQAPETAVLLFDGIFLQRPELAHCWDLVIFLSVDFAVSVPRGASRGGGYGSPDPAAATNRRYVAGQRRYPAEVRPGERADVTIDNTDLNWPLVLRSSSDDLGVAGSQSA
ncbi:MAG: uridine kinase [Actinomycetota bacterium]|nr:uridine kinase [Actinomycetota bacterium]MDQ2958845.1 uridine kinase [Actinomycetota bacterium]